MSPQGWSASVLGILAAFAATAPDARHEGLKIVARETFPAGVTATTTYVGGDQVRVESHMSSPVTGTASERHEHVRIERCDLNRMFVLDLQRRTYLAAPLRPGLNAIERVALSVHQTSQAKDGPEIVVETTTVDTGERKMAFGYSARRVLTTRRQIQKGESDLTDETLTDGWYIDLETRPGCQRAENGARAVLIGSVRPAGGRNNPPRVTFNDVGKREEGFAIETKVTWPSAGKGENTAPPPAIHMVVTDVARQALPPDLFEVPSGFRSTDGILGRLAVRYGRTVQVLQSAVASWFR
jgi:hypothetical protein